MMKLIENSGKHNGVTQLILAMVRAVMVDGL